MAVSVEADGLTYTMASGDSITGNIFVRKVTWLKPTTGGHGLTLTNAGGKIIDKATCEAANVDEVLCLDQWCNGLTVACDSGTVVVRMG